MRTWITFGLMVVITICGFIGFVFKHQPAGLLYLIFGGVVMGFILKQKGILP